MAKKPSMDRQKIKIAKIEIKNHLQVTFSKRRSGLFKKASELCILYGIEVTIVVFSPVGKVFSFGHPNVDSVVDQFLSQNRSPIIVNGGRLIEVHQNATVRELNLQLTQVLNELEAKKRQGKTLEHMRKARRRQCWWEAPVEELGLNELEQLRNSMEELKKNVTNHANKFFVMATTNHASPFFLLDGAEMVNTFESKPPQINASSTAPFAHNFGYGHGFFFNKVASKF